jgi:DNA-binding beta-propeller fold protein YncE
MKFRSFGRAALAFAVLPGLATLLTSCGGGHTIGYAYVLSSPSTATSTIFAYQVRSDNGALYPAVSKALPTLITGAVATVVSPDNQNLYVLYGSPTDPTTGLPLPSSNPGTIVHYGIRTYNGDITPLDTVQTAGTDPVALAIDPSGNYLYAVDTYAPGSGSGVSGPGDLTVFALQPDSQGTAAIPGGTIIAPTCSAPGTPTLNGEGTGTAGSGCYYPVGYGPRGISQTATAAGATGYVYVTNAGNTATASSGTCFGTVSGFSLAYGDPSSGTAGGQLANLNFGSTSGCTPYPATALPVGTTPWGITSVSYSGSNPVVYVTDYSGSAVYQFPTANGILQAPNITLVGGQPENVLAGPASTVYVSNFKSGTVSAFTADTTGALTAVSGSPYVVGTGPTCMAIDPDNLYFYVVNYISGSVSGFSLAGSGQLAALENQPFLIGSSSGGVNSSLPSCMAIASNETKP